jgi:DDE superfamily endonuclease
MSQSPGASGGCGSRCARLAITSFWMNVASRRICCDDTAAAAGARGCAITRPSVIGRRTLSWPRSASRGWARRRYSTAPSITSRFSLTSNKSWRPRSVRVTWSVLDHLALHKQPEVRTAIEAVGAHLRFLPPYRPDFNPIELAFAKLKAFIRAVRPRTFDQVCELITIALRLFTLDECRHFIQHCGYRVSTAL